MRVYMFICVYVCDDDDDDGCRTSDIHVYPGKEKVLFRRRHTTWWWWWWWLVVLSQSGRRCIYAQRRPRYIYVSVCGCADWPHEARAPLSLSLYLSIYLSLFLSPLLSGSFCFLLFFLLQVFGVIKVLPFNALYCKKRKRTQESVRKKDEKKYSWFSAESAHLWNKNEGLRGHARTRADRVIYFEILWYIYICYRVIRKRYVRSLAFGNNEEC